MSFRDEITSAFSTMYDAFRADVQGEETNLRIFDDDGALLETITNGWLFKEISEEQGGGHRLEIRITDRDGTDFTSINAFGLHGKRYEREGYPNPPVGNPAEWVFNARPVGLDTVTVQYVLSTSLGEILIDDFGAGLAET